MQTDRSALQHTLNQPKLTGPQMSLLETLKEYDFDVEYYPDARSYIQDELSRPPDYKKPPIPRTPTASMTTSTTQTLQPTLQRQAPQQLPQQTLQPTVQPRAPR